MPRFSRRSLKNLSECDPILQLVCKLAIKVFDFSVICGHRGKVAQNRAFESGKSKLRFPQGKHNKIPSEAVDLLPYKTGWKSDKEFYYLAGIIQGIVQMIDDGFEIRWGGDWDGDNDFDDNSFKDLCHIEIIKKRR